MSHLVKIGLPRLDGRLDRLQTVPTLLHVALNLPGKLDVVRDVQVEAEVQQVAHSRVVHGVQALDDDNGGGLNGLRGVEGSVDVVVDGLLYRLAALQGGELLVHEVEVVLASVQRGELGHLSPGTVVQVEVVQADHGRLVGYEGVGLPRFGETAAEGAHRLAAEDVGQPSHES